MVNLSGAVGLLGDVDLRPKGSIFGQKAVSSKGDDREKRQLQSEASAEADDGRAGYKGQTADRRGAATSRRRVDEEKEGEQEEAEKEEEGGARGSATQRSPGSQQRSPGGGSAAMAEGEAELVVRSPSGSQLVSPNEQFPFGLNFTFWLLRRPVLATPTAKQEETLEALGTFGDVQEFWRYWNNIRRDRLQASSSLSVFRDPERPRAGKRAPGGRWIITCAQQGAPATPASVTAAPSSLASSPCAVESVPEGEVDADGAALPRGDPQEIFKLLVLALVGGHFEEDSEAAPTGVLLSARESAPALVEVWNRAGNAETNATVLSVLRELIGTEASIEYIEHKSAAVPATPSAAPPTPASTKNKRK